jgi:carbonic anhydrase/acetyltransferase-like protein (isoleucine patch superfamily)
MALYELDGHKVSTPGVGRYFVAPAATVIGRVTLGDAVSVWPGAVIRGDNEPIRIGARANIQEGCVLHVDAGFPLEVGEESTIGHMVMLHGCTIGRFCLIGIGSIVLNGARIGDGSLIGAGTLIPEGKVIPPGSVVLGVPGKVIREVTDKDRARIQEGLDDYQQKWPLYAGALKAQPG